MSSTAARPQQTTYATSRVKHSYVIGYEGKIADFFAFRIEFPGYTSLDSMTLRNKIRDWLMWNVPGHHFGNGFPHLPGVEFAKRNKTDFFILAPTLEGVRAIENRFTILGLTPSLLV